MKIGLLTREFPPDVYGGAGVHAAYLSRELASLVELEVHCFGSTRHAAGVTAHQPWPELEAGLDGDSLGAMSVDLAMAAAVEGADLVHSHTWYTNLGGHLAKILHGVPHVVTCHSLEPLRPWKADQLGRGYALSCFCERTGVEGADALVAVSDSMRDDICTAYPSVEAARVSVIPNGIDAEEFRPDRGTDVLERLGVDPSRPSVVFVGRMTRQKGIEHALAAAAHIDPAAQVVLCAGAADTPALATRMRDRAAQVALARGGVVWLEKRLGHRDLVQLLSNASVFLCPSLYEPFGIVNLEALACEVPVVASAVGGIPEVVVDGEHGHLVAVDLDAEGVPLDPDGFARDLAARVNQLLADPTTARRLGQAGRRRVLERFSWASVARRTAELYEQVLGLRPDPTLRR